MKHQNVLSDEERKKRILAVKELIELADFQKKRDSAMRKEGLI